MARPATFKHGFLCPVMPNQLRGSAPPRTASCGLHARLLWLRSEEASRGAVSSFDCRAIMQKVVKEAARLFSGELFSLKSQLNHLSVAVYIAHFRH